MSRFNKVCCLTICFMGQMHKKNSAKKKKKMKENSKKSKV